MRIQLSEETVIALEDVSGQRMTKNGDKIIRQVAEMAEKADNGASIQMQICDNTRQEMQDV